MLHSEIKANLKKSLYEVLIPREERAFLSLAFSSLGHLLSYIFISVVFYGFILLMLWIIITPLLRG